MAGFTDWGAVENFQANTLAAKLKATLPTQWAPGIDALAARQSDPGALVWRRDALRLERLQEFAAEHGDAITWSMGYAAICERAQAIAEGLDSLMALWPEPLTEPERLAILRDACRRLDVDPPDADTDAGMLARGLDKYWWRKRLSTKVRRISELGAIKLGIVSRTAGGYCSDESVRRRQEQLARSEAMMKQALVRNEAGQVYALAELAKLTVSNPDIRRGELMTRIRGCEEYADAAGHVGQFLTLTAPSRFHRMKAPPPGTKLPAVKNKRYDGSTPRDAQLWLRKRFARARAAWAKAGIEVYGFRVAEPHHDSCPHWHALLWFADEAQARKAQEIIRATWLRVDKADAAKREPSERQGRHLLTLEPGARKNRVKAIWLEAGGAAGYIAKYVAKNVGGSYTVNHLDGHHDGSPQQEMFDVATGDVPGYVRVNAWAADWGIRQFQAIGQPSVVAWREMRRVTKDQVEQARIEGDGIAWQLYGAVHKSGTVSADWRRYMELMGGPCRKRGQWAAKVAHRETEEPNRYGETVTKRVAVGLELQSGRWLISRRMAWKHVAEPSPAPDSRASMARPWTRFNNCSARLTGALRRALVGRGRHEIEDWTTPEAVAYHQAMTQREAWQ